MTALTLDECKEVIRLHYLGKPTWAISGQLKISSGHIKAIRYCNKLQYPLTDYLMIFDKQSKDRPIDEKPCAWDIRLSMRLARLPFSEWANAI